jgi:transcriptional regulator NrdR family protein
MKGKEKQVRLKVIKADGSVEQYLHTKVLGTIYNALAATGQADTDAAEYLTEAVTYFLYKRDGGGTVASGEIFSMIKAVLSSTDYEGAAVALVEHHLQRRIRRNRIEVICADIEQLADAEMLYGSEMPRSKSPWNKSVIANDLVNRHNLSRQTARTIASMVEERILNMGINVILSSLIKQLVLGDAAAILHAQRQLQTV